MAKPIFTTALFDFLEELSRHNDREWFAANRERYEAHVREPALELVRAMEPRLKAISRHLVADDRKTGGSLMRVHRDTRFSADKTPYKTNVGLGFHHDAGKDVAAPGFYLHLALDGSWAGLGLWQPETAALTRIRDRIVAEPERWGAVLEDVGFNAHWRRQGEALKRVPRGYEAGHRFADDLKLKSHIAGSKLETADVTSPDLPERLAERYAAARPYMVFLAESLDHDF